MGLTEDQKLAVETVDLNVLVSAGAGSGKTHVLVERYLEIMKKDQSATVANLVAVTYTTKAANEMRSRLKARMQELVSQSEGKEKERWANCLGAVDGARIGTIHSLCESMLKAFPVEAAIDPSFEVLNDLEKASLLDNCLEQAVHEAAAGQMEERHLLVSHPVNQIKTWVQSLINSSLQYEESKECLAGLDNDSMERHCLALLASAHQIASESILTSSQFHMLVTFLQDNPWRKGGLLEEHRAAITSLADRAASLSGDGSHLPKLQCLLAILGVEVRNAGGNTDEAKELRGAIRQLKNLIAEHADELPLTLSDTESDAFMLIRGLAQLTERVQNLFALQKKANMRLDFNDMIRLAYQVLSKDKSYARRHYNETLKAILVDEFQDTNRLQAQLIALMAGAQTRLFLIGDDKQSIYKFQGADVSIFNEWRSVFAGQSSDKSKAVSLAGSSLIISLKKSFRSHAQIVSFVNAIFGRLMDDSVVAPYKAKFQALEAFRNDAQNETRVDVIAFDATDGQGNREKLLARRMEARAVALWIATLTEQKKSITDKLFGSMRPLRYGDFAILVPTNAEFGLLEEALSEFDIPFVTLAASGYLTRQETYDLENLLRFIACPADSHALLGVLRSPIFAVSDDLIHEMFAGSNDNLWGRLRSFERDGGGAGKELERAVRLLQTFIDWSARYSLGDLVRKIILKTHYDIVLLSTRAGKQRSRNLWKFASLAWEHNHLSAGEFVDMLERMRQLRVKQSHAPLDAGDSVKLMTIHGSKGLEFPAVALPALSSDVFGRADKLLFHRQFGLAFDGTRDKKAEKPALFRLCRRLERDMEEAERKRLLYVAMTRARDYLGIFVERQGRNITSFRSWITDTLAMDKEGISPDGLYTVGGGDGQATYNLCSWDSQSITERARQWHDERIAVPDDWSRQLPRFDAVVPLPVTECSDRFNWQGTLRVTPPADGWKVAEEPAIVGTFFHVVMQHLPADANRPSVKLMEMLAQSPPVGIIHPKKRELLLADCHLMLDKYEGGELQALLRSARNRLHEVPYCLLARGENGGTEAMSGRIDLLLQDGQGSWHIVDFKTDHFEEDELPAQLNAHRRQLHDYVQHLHALTGIKASAKVYFARQGKLVDLQMDAGILPFLRVQQSS